LPQAGDERREVYPQLIANQFSVTGRRIVFRSSLEPPIRKVTVGPAYFPTADSRFIVRGWWRPFGRHAVTAGRGIQITNPPIPHADNCSRFPMVSCQHFRLAAVRPSVTRMAL
jgi:hypothetical protein